MSKVMASNMNRANVHFISDCLSMSMMLGVFYTCCRTFHLITQKLLMSHSPPLQTLNGYIQNFRSLSEVSHFLWVFEFGTLLFLCYNNSYKTDIN